MSSQNRLRTSSKETQLNGKVERPRPERQWWRKAQSCSFRMSILVLTDVGGRSLDASLSEGNSQKARCQDT